MLSQKVAAYSLLRTWDTIRILIDPVYRYRKIAQVTVIFRIDIRLWFNGKGSQIEVREEAGGISDSTL